MNKRIVAFFASTMLTLPFFVQAQAITKNYRVVNSAVPFLTISPDSRAAAMGDAGVASSPDANSIYWNTAKLAYIDKSNGFSLSYAPWLRDLTNDMGLINATYFAKVNKNSALSVNLNYFNQGLIQFTSNTGASQGDFQSREFAITGGYGMKLAQDFSMGINVKYIRSMLLDQGKFENYNPGSTVASDIGFYYRKDRPTQSQERGVKASYGLVFQNVGGKINYGRGLTYFIPANLKIGTGIEIHPDFHNTFTILLDANKLMVPTPQADGTIPDVGAMQGIFTSFGDAPDGMREELREVMLSGGFEYRYENLFALRGGYFYEANTKGGRRYYTAGVGLKIKDSYGLDLAYLIPTTSGSPLANTWRFTFIFDIKNKNLRAPENDISIEQ